MPCNCVKRKVVKQPIRKAPPRQKTITRVSTGRRIIHRVIR